MSFEGRFMDRFLPIPIIGDLVIETLEAVNGIPRYIVNDWLARTVWYLRSKDIQYPLISGVIIIK